MDISAEDFNVSFKYSFGATPSRVPEMNLSINVSKEKTIFSSEDFWLSQHKRLINDDENHIQQKD